MEKRILLESRGKEPNQVIELNLDNVRTVGEFEGLTNEFSSLQKLSVIKAGLTSFKGFPKLQKLEKLDVSENRISSGLNHLRDCTSLTHLCLSSNKFKDFTALEPLKSLENLRHLEVANNPLSDSDDARSRIFSLLPNLEYLDSADREGNEVSEDEDEDDIPCNGVNHITPAPGGDEAEDDVEDGDDEEDEVEDEEEESEEDEEDGPGLADLYNNPNLNDEEEGDGDYDEDGEDEEEDDLLEEEDEDEDGESTRGKKRKHDEEDGAE